MGKLILPFGGGGVVGEIRNKTLDSGKGGYVPWSNPFSFTCSVHMTIHIHIIIYHIGQKRYPFHISFFDKWYPLYILFIYFATRNAQRKKKQFENTLQNESGEQALNRNCRAYNVKLP